MRESMSAISLRHGDQREYCGPPDETQVRRLGGHHRCQIRYGQVDREAQAGREQSSVGSLRRDVDVSHRSGQSVQTRSCAIYEGLNERDRTSRQSDKGVFVDG